MKPPPIGWPRISSAIYYDDPKAAIDWLCRAFGFKVHLLIEADDGSVRHSELTFGGGLIMVGGLNSEAEYRAVPSGLDGANTQSMMVYVDDAEAHLAKAKEAGATIVSELSTHDYGEDHWADTGYECTDLGGHHWWFFQRLRTLGADA